MIGGLMLLAACGLWEGSASSDPSGQGSDEPAVVLPAPPAPPVADFTLSGAIEARVRDYGLECRSSMTGILDAAWTGQIDGEDAVLITESPYRLSLATGEIVERPARAELYIGAERWVWEPARNPSSVLLDIRTSRFQGWTSTSDQGRSLTLDGLLTCPPATADPPIPDALVDLLARETGAAVVRYSHFDFGRAREGRTISARMKQREADAAVRRIRTQLPPGWIAFRGTSRFDPALDLDGVDVVIGPGTDNRHILRLAHLSPGRWTTEQVIDRIDDWDSRYGVDVFFAMDDSVGFLIDHPPEDLMPFALELTAFCPDIVRNSLGSPEALAEAIRTSGGVLLWWD